MYFTYQLFAATHMKLQFLISVTPISTTEALSSSAKIIPFYTATTFFNRSSEIWKPSSMISSLSKQNNNSLLFHALNNNKQMSKSTDWFYPKISTVTKNITS